MKWLEYLLGSLVAKFTRSSSKTNGSPSIQIKVVEQTPPKPKATSKQVKITSVTVSNSKPNKSQVMFSDLEEKFIEGYFNQKDMDMSEEDFTVAMKSMLAAKIIKEVEMSGQTFYKLTDVGKAIYKHRHHSKPKDQN